MNIYFIQLMNVIIFIYNRDKENYRMNNKTTFQDVFRILYIRRRIFQSIEELSEIAMNHQSSSSASPRFLEKKPVYIKGRELQKLSVFDLVAKYALPWSMVGGLFEGISSDQVDAERQHKMISRGIFFFNARDSHRVWIRDDCKICTWRIGSGTNPQLSRRD
ncbi:hypothetical protein DFA_06379 [Cavenderia fasciculata]|uniref:Uncharacterized protein n=1 Tax=Cavenderia fasciculata TaxID=261658 RepID=F4PKV7_CACFS|nr:uncharacterized protein DFA_06379 [Cavenderia fasciculata]EGG24231.1 hypothetical protein DFA_06379 [Cavenderia fasciculata]|eukprot:XP_004362082.1 hypothetical protein DFA_06379 [Cavenderia fasciculata]